MVKSCGLQPLKNGQAAQQALSEYRIRVLVSRASRPTVSRAVRSQTIRTQSWPLQSKIWTAAPVPSINHALSAGTMSETAAPGKAKDDEAMASKAA